MLFHGHLKDLNVIVCIYINNKMGVGEGSSSNLHAAVFGAGSLAVLGAEFDSFSLVAPEHKHPYKRHARHERGRGGGGGGLALCVQPRALKLHH